MLATKALTSMRHAKQYTNIKKRGVFWVACFTLLSTLLPAQSRVDSLVQEIEALKSAYVQELDSLWDELHAVSSLLKREGLSKEERYGPSPAEMRMQEYIHNTCHIGIKFDGHFTRDELVYPRYIAILESQSGAIGWHLMAILLKRFDESADKKLCGGEFDVFIWVLGHPWGLSRNIDLVPIMDQLAAMSTGPRRERLREFAHYLRYGY